MFKNQLRQAIAKLYPDRYNFFTWKKLIPEFVDAYFVRTNQVRLLAADNQRLEQLYQADLANVLTSLTPELPREKQWASVLRTMLSLAIGIDLPQQEDNATLLDNFVAETEKAYQQQLDEYMEKHTDEQEFNPTARSEQLMQAIVFQAILKGQSFESLANEAYALRLETEGQKRHIELLEKISAQHKEHLDLLFPVAQGLSQRVEDYNQSIKLSRRQN